MDMDILEAISLRHTVRKFMKKPLSADVVEKLNARIAENNQKYGLNLKLVTNDNQGVWGILRLLFAKNANNYLVLSGPDEPGIGELFGYCGIDVALYAQTLGLNSWWIGGTYSRKAVERLADGSATAGIIVLGYGEKPGKFHKSKKALDVSVYEGGTPEWFVRGVEAALLAPTAMNKQEFFITGRDKEVAIHCEGSFAEIDRGILKYHFEVAAGRENFYWVE
ncbi:MAG: hypothetical protein K6A31_03205 [Fibrobacter sp.]|nr:hypothetical protein [Fibrobacter sp.]